MPPDGVHLRPHSHQTGGHRAGYLVGVRAGGSRVPATAVGKASDPLALDVGIVADVLNAVGLGLGALFVRRVASGGRRQRQRRQPVPIQPNPRS